jgi:predicted RecB family nuclease
VARLANPDAAPCARAALPIARAAHEFFLDVEADPLADAHVYLHGVLERTTAAGAGAERFHAFFADDPATGERDAFAGAMELLRGDTAALVYVYSAYVRTSFRNLQARHSDVCARDEVEALFDPRRTVDLLTSVVRQLTECPASDRSIKTLARMCGFE